MINIQNTDAINAIRNGAKLSISEGFPQQLIRSVQPVMDMTPNFHRTLQTKQLARTSSGAVTIHTTSATKDTYIFGVGYSMIKNATNDVATGNLGLTAVIGGATYYLITVAVLTLTAQDISTFYSLKHPIKLDRNTAIALDGTFTAGNMVRNPIIYYYEVDVD